jgi:hypothetical protein
MGRGNSWSMIQELEGFILCIMSERVREIPGLIGNRKAIAQPVISLERIR